MAAGEYFTSYGDRMGLLRYRSQRIGLLLLLPIPILAPFILGGGQVSLMTNIFIMIIAVLGLHVILGYAGEIVLAQGAFMAIGAYTATQAVGAGFGLIPGMILGGFMTAFVAVIFGLPSYRVKGFYIAISTLALQFISEWFFAQSALEWIHGGSQQSMPREMPLIGESFIISSATEQYFFVFFIMGLFILLTFNLSRSGIGRTFRGIHENDLSAGVLGVNVFRNKLLAYAIGGFMIGVAGSLYASYIGFIDPTYFTIDLTLEHYIMLLIGGIGRVWGVILGVSIITIAEAQFYDFVAGFGAEAAPLVLVLFGALIIVVLLVEPKGVMSFLSRVKQYLRSWPYAY